MAESDAKAGGGLVAVFGENDGGHSFVTLCRSVKSETIHEIIPQEDVWNCIDAIRANHAQIAVVPLHNSISNTEAATLKGLATGEIQILGRIKRQTNHVLVGVRDNIIAVNKRWSKESNYAGTRDGTHSDIPEKGEPPHPEKPGPQALARFVLVLRKVFTSTHVYEQARGKLNGSDFRHDVQVEHTSNPVRILLRHFRERQTHLVMDEIDRSMRPEQKNNWLTPNDPTPRPVDDNYFAAALVAEGLLQSAEHVCRIDNRLCSQRLSEVYEALEDLQTNSHSARDLPHNETTFLVIAHKAHKGGVAWAEGEGRMGVHFAEDSSNASDLQRGPLNAEPSWRVTFLLKLKSEENWIELLKDFEKTIKGALPNLNLKFDQAADRLAHQGKPVLLVSALINGHAGDDWKAFGKKAKELLEHEHKKHDRHMKMLEAGAAGWFANGEDPAKKLEWKLCGVYPSWMIEPSSGAWLPEFTKVDEQKAQGSWAGWMLFALLWVVLVFGIIMLSQPNGAAELNRIWQELLGAVKGLLPG